MKTHCTTRLIHHDYQPPQGFAAPQPAVYKASTIFLPNIAASRNRNALDRESHTYGTCGTPTSYLLEQRLCTLKAAGTACCFPADWRPSPA